MVFLQLFRTVHGDGGDFSRSAPKQKNIFNEQLTHEDIVSAFAENNSIMRDALYRVELKLRDPFDRIMRETCFFGF